MADAIKRTQTIYVSEEQRRSSSSTQWLLELRHATHPISDNNALKVFICGEDSFKDIAAQITEAKESIDICCWGFDPAMELVRKNGGMWPRGPTYGDLLIAAGKRKGVTVRLLVWYDLAATAVASKNPRNMPGYTHDVDAFRDDLLTIAAGNSLSAPNSLALAQAAAAKRPRKHQPTTEQVHIDARRDYCRAWYWAVFKGRLTGVHIRTRAGVSAAVSKSLSSEDSRPSALSVEGAGMDHFGTHHQKPILIDFYHNDGEKAVGYVMGLNSMTDYWDTADHQFEDPRREREGARSYKPDLGHTTMKPYRDYACRIEGGRALVALYNNFIKAWERAEPGRKRNAVSELGSRAMPAIYLKPAPAASPQVQILRTQPEEGDKTIKDVYLHATDVATRAAGYLYVENQYFQWEEWAQRLMRVRERTMDQWNASRIGAGLSLKKMPVMHVFIVIPVPEQEGMIPRTYDTLATLGQQAHMDGQAALIKDTNERPPHHYAFTGEGPPIDMGVAVPEVIAYANKISKPDAITLETQFGIKVCTAMLNACGSNGRTFDYREIYIHSKLLLIDDTFFTLGSANMNQRSMAVDSEINVATIDPVCAKDLRKRIWGQLSGNQTDCSGGEGSRTEIANSFKKWMDLMNENGTKKDKNMRATGLLLPLADKRSSTSRVG